MQDSKTQSSFSRFTRQYGRGKSRAGCCMSVCTGLSQSLQRTACSWPGSSEGVSNASTRGTASPEYSYTLREPEELRRRTGSQDTPECEPITLNQLCYNKDTQCPEGTHASQHIPEKKLWLTRSAAPSQAWTAVPWENWKAEILSTALKTCMWRVSSVPRYLNSACKQLAFKSQKITNPNTNGCSN